LRGTLLDIERPTRTVATWLFEGWPGDEVVETVISTEDGGITSMTDILEFTDAASLADQFHGDNEGLQVRLDQLEDLLGDLRGVP
jgi:uncharacterized protein YndB with AHSA1/START domain